MIIKDALKWGHESLLLTSDSARLDAEVLLSHILRKPLTFLLAHDETKVGFWNLWKYKRMIEKRKRGVPVAYLTGHKEFFMLDFIVNRHVLVPRPDTEILVDCVISYLKSVYRNSRLDRASSYDKRVTILLEVGTGSGCIPIAVCKNVKGVKAIATDISRKALKVAKKNVKKHQLKSRITLVRSDLLKNVSFQRLSGHEVVVTANLPYIPTQFQVSPELKYEPSISLFGGEDGVELYKKLVQQLNEIKPKAIFFELFEDQIAILKTKLPDYKLKYVKNMSGEARVLCMERT